MPDPAVHALLALRPILGVPGPDGRLHDQGAAVSLPHLAAAGARRGADGGQRGLGRRAAEGRHLRLPAALRALAPDVSLALGLPLIGTLAVIGIVYGARAPTPRTTSRSWWPTAASAISACHARHLRPERGRPRRQPFANGQSRPVHRRPVPSGRHDLRTLPHPEDRGLRRHGPAPAAVRLSSGVHLHDQHWPAGAERVRRRSADHHGRHRSQWQRNQFPIFGIVGAFGMFLGAWYLLTMVQRVIFGNVKEPPEPPGKEHDPIVDLNGREIITLAPIVALCVLIGVYPQPILDTARPDVKTIESIANKARDRYEKTTARQPGGTVAETEPQGGRP